MHHSGQHGTLWVRDANSGSRVTRMGRPVLLYVTCLLVSSLVLLKAWEIVSGGSSQAASLRFEAAAAAGGTQAQGLQQQRPAIPVQGIRLSGMPEFKHYWVGNSTIPGAGLGVFARTYLPAGTLWNFEDAEPSSTLALTLPLWQSLAGLEQHIRAAGLSNHPVAAVWGFFDVYAYSCDGKLISSLTSSTFTNHAPEQQEASSQPGTAGTVHAHRSAAAAATVQLQGSSTSMHETTDLKRYANSAALDGEGPVQQQRRALGVTPWQICTVLVTLRDIQAGEEILEDYSEFDPLCRFRGDCPEFLNLSPLHDDTGQDHQEWTRAVLVQSPDTYVGNSSSAGGGLGLFAARDLPAGTVWNKQDAAHALTVTREQWTRLLQLHQALRASGVEKPLFSQMVNAFRSHGFCCPLDGRMYVPFTTSLLAKRQPSQVNSTQPDDQGSSTSNSGKQQLHVRQQRANAVHVEDAAGVGDAADITVSVGASMGARCTWLQTVADVRKGEELVVSRSKQFECDWPGMKS